VLKREPESARGRPYGILLSRLPKEAAMYLIIRKFDRLRSVSEAARRAESGIGQLLKQSPGFRGYYVFDAGDRARRRWCGTGPAEGGPHSPSAVNGKLTWNLPGFSHFV
jgi:hypothetical protein